MDSLHKQAYVVTPFEGEVETAKGKGLIPIFTDGSYFLSKIKDRAVAQKIMLPDDIYVSAENLFATVKNEHHRLHNIVKVSNHPELIYVASYQDGMMHALGRVGRMRITGEYSQGERIRLVIENYLKWQREKLCIAPL
jgi:hypothetical protein